MSLLISMISRTSPSIIQDCHRSRDLSITIAPSPDIFLISKSIAKDHISRIEPSKSHGPQSSQISEQLAHWYQRAPATGERHANAIQPDIQGSATLFCTPNAEIKHINKGKGKIAFVNGHNVSQDLKHGGFCETVGRFFRLLR